MLRLSVIRLIVIDKTLLCERFSPHILKASTENSQVQKTCKYRKKVSTEYRQVQKIGKYRIQASTEHRQVQTCKYILLYRQVEDMLIKYFVVENMLIKYIFLYPCTCLKIWLNAKPRNALLDNCQIETASR